eukprot:TRINITY_DN1699_c1_g2_i1.p1 TRINITY_DN1699_c1_g2~~TRINITY_DN1699_c1_g2_i1.p1  ORF type:complete len:343 (-),score=95.56 TRINITY_DN1699_c1_g2_i1:231-1259(-)
MYDLKARRTFLKRTETSVQPDEVYLGAIITVYSRQLQLTEYADKFTATQLEAKREQTLAIIKPNAYMNMGKIMQAVNDAGFHIGQMKMFKMSLADAEEFYAEHADQEWFGDLCAFMSADTVVAMQLVRENAVKEWRELMGPTNVLEAMKSSPDSMRALYGDPEDASANGTHGSASVDDATRELDFFFGSDANARFGCCARLDNCSLCLIKPHAVLAGQTGNIVDGILEDGFEISALELFTIDRVNAEEFYEVYKGVISEYADMVEQLTSGPFLALEICAPEDTVENFRALCGPIDSEIARLLRPNTLRAKFGVNKVNNAVHCTDLPTDGVLECEYFFKILQE